MGNLDKNGVVEEYNGKWGALVVLSAKPHQENMPCYEYQWRMCVPYKTLNYILCPFDLPIPSCDDEVQEIYTEANYFIAVDIDSGYCQVVTEEEVLRRM